jgi:hypothetical protein
VLVPTHACTTANASVKYSLYVPHRDLENFPSPNGKMADMLLAPTHACTTANTSVNYSMYVPQIPCKFPSPPWGEEITCANLAL